MSRIGKQPIILPGGVTATVDGALVTIKGPKGELSYTVHPYISVKLTDGALICTVHDDVTGRLAKQAAALWGTTRARLASILHGVSEGFEKKLELHGVGYRASLKGSHLELVVGYSHPVLVEAPAGISFSVDKEVVTVAGIDAVLVGQLAADIRQVRKPEPYKGKGIRYQGERVRRKVGKVVGTTA